MVKVKSKKTVAKKPATKKAPAKKAKKPAQSKATGAKKKTDAKKAAKPPAKKPVGRRVKKTAGKLATKKSLSKKPTATKKASVRKAAKKTVKKAAIKKAVVKKAAKPVSKVPAKKTPAKKPKAKKKETLRPVGESSEEVQRADMLNLPPEEPDFSKDEEFNLPNKIKELVQLAQDQGHLTISDINEALPKDLVTPEKLDEVFAKLKSLEVEIVEQLDSAPRQKPAQSESEAAKSRLDILDDPVRMYLKQMGQVPLLTREQEVEISKRIEAAELEVKRILYSLGFTAKEHIALAEKLTADPPKERFDRVTIDKVIETREKHIRALHRLIKKVREEDSEVDKKYTAWRRAAKSKSKKAYEAFEKLNEKLQKNFPKFLFKQKVIEEIKDVIKNY